MSAFWGRAARGISAATEAWLEEASRRARGLHPERFAPDGTALIEYAGSSWAERLASWTRAQSGLAVSTDATADVPGSDLEETAAEVVMIALTPASAPLPITVDFHAAAGRTCSSCGEAFGSWDGDGEQAECWRCLAEAADQDDELDLEPAIPDDTDEPPIPDHDLDAPYARIREGDRP